MKRWIVIQKSELDKNWWHKYVGRNLLFDDTKPKRTFPTNERLNPRHEWDFEPTEHEAPICQHFSCNKILSLREQLFGNLCIKHQPQKEIYL